MYPMVAAKSPRLHILDTVKLDDLVGRLGRLGGGFGLSGCVHAGDLGEAPGLEVLLELHLCDIGGGPFELGRGVAVGEGKEVVDSRRLGEIERLGREGYLLLL